MFHAVGALGDAASADDPLKAAGFWEQRMLNCLQENWFFTDQTSYVRIPHLVHRSRAKGLLAQGNASDAILEVRHCQQMWPGELNVVEECIPLLDASGRKADADELFDSAYSRIEKTCRLFPNSALHHNNLAWLSAKCQRRLDEALVHVQRALELAPDSAQYIDTLAEVHFQRGEIAKAIEQAKRCIEIEPDTEFYQKQLERFSAAMPSSSEN
jgi:tetratricopeptide (TPR) repeat protein